MATPYKLRCNLTGHEKDVRAISTTIFPENGLISGSRDNTSCIWTEIPGGNGFEKSLILRGHTNFVSSICIMPPDDNFPQGLVLTGSNDKSILAYTPNGAEPVFKLTGHEQNVCALACGKFGMLLSGSWDKTARVWLDKKCIMVLEGHEMAVWAVGIISAQGIMLTGSADKTLKSWKAGKCIQTFRGHEDCVRGIAVSSESDFLSCSNDATIRRWALSSGDCLAIYYGHTNYIYSISILPNGVDFISGGEDRSMRVWKDGKCFQTIYHPCESVWAVCAFANGDIASGTSDGLIRIFTQCPERVASQEIIAAHEASLASAPVTSQSLGDIKVEDLPGPDSLKKPGKKDGQTTMINTGDGVDVYQWDESQAKWLKIGAVVGSSGGTQSTSGKSLHEGKEYDYVFTIDIKEGAPPLKLPFNVTDDPWFAAQKFIYKHDLPQVHLEEVANFITENTKGVTLGTGSVVENSDPFTGGDRYIPSGQEGATGAGGSDPFTGSGRYIPENTSDTGSSNSHFPLTSYYFFDSANADSSKIIGKLKQFNEIIEPELQVSDSLLECLVSLLDGKPTADSIKVLDKIINWPPEHVFPAIDILRMAVKDMDVCKTFCSRPNFITHLSGLACQGNSPATRMLSLRTLTNLFRHDDGTALNMQHIDNVLQAAISCKDLTTKTGQIAFSALILNYCVKLRGQDDLENKCKCIQAVGELLPLGMDPEASYCLLVAMGTLVAGDDVSKALAKSIELPGMLARFQSSPVGKVAECSQLLASTLS